MQGYKKTITELPGQPPNSEKKVQKYPQTMFSRKEGKIFDKSKEEEEEESGAMVDR